jgi:hypothetical protein
MATVWYFTSTVVFAYLFGNPWGGISIICFYVVVLIGLGVAAVV